HDGAGPQNDFTDAGGIECRNPLYVLGDECAGSVNSPKHVATLHNIGEKSCSIDAWSRGAKSGQTIRNCGNGKQCRSAKRNTANCFGTRISWYSDVHFLTLVHLSNNRQDQEMRRRQIVRTHPYKPRVGHRQALAYCVPTESNKEFA